MRKTRYYFKNTKDDLKMVFKITPISNAIIVNYDKILGKFIGKITTFTIFASVNSIDCKNKTEHSLMHLGDKKER